MLTIILVVILVVLLLGALPVWPYSRNWGYTGSGVLGAFLVILVLALVLGWV